MSDTAEIDAGHFVAEIWGLDIGHGELAAVIADALTARGTAHERVRVSFTRDIPPGSGDES